MSSWMLWTRTSSRLTWLQSSAWIPYFLRVNFVVILLIVHSKKAVTAHICISEKKEIEPITEAKLPLFPLLLLIYCYAAAFSWSSSRCDSTSLVKLNIPSWFTLQTSEYFAYPTVWMKKHWNWTRNHFLAVKCKQRCCDSKRSLYMQLFRTVNT